jgi:iron complex transport system permease protein
VKFKNELLLLFSFCLLVISMVVSAAVGAVDISLAKIIDIILGGGSQTEKAILLQLRLPRVIEAAVVGLGLSVVGTFFQGLLRNPMADPYVLGVSSGAAFGATIAITLGLGILGLSFFAFISAIVTIFGVYLVAKEGSRVSITTMLLAGIAVSAFLSAVISLLMLLNRDELSTIVFWTMGGFNLVSWDKVFFSLPVIIGGTAVMYTYSRDLNVIITGEQVAEHLGVDTEKVKKIILTVGALVTAASVAVGGIIGFVGLIIPHMSRLLVGPDNRILVPFSGILGASFLVLADAAARVLLKPAEIPVGIITAAFGGPFFLYLLVKNKRNKGM